MALANYRIISLVAEGFRGFTTPQSISFEGRNIFIFGQNGLGKSSVIEAIQWCLFGGTDIQVRNNLYEKQECRVVLHLAGPKGKLTIRRELNLAALNPTSALKTDVAKKRRFVKSSHSLQSYGLLNGLKSSLLHSTQLDAEAART